MIFLGDLIKLERIKCNLTQEQLADEIHYDKSRISRTETGKDTQGASFEMLHSLSYSLAFDFISIFKYNNRFSNYHEYILYFKLKNAISTGNNELILEFVKSNNFDLAPCDNKDIYYAKVYAYTLLYKDDVHKSLSLCLTSLSLSTSTIQDLNLKPYIQEDKLGVYTVLLLNLVTTNKINEAFILARKLYDYFKKFLFNDESYIEQSFFIKKLYILTVNNLSHVYFLKKELNTSLDLCDEAIDIATTYSISKNLNRIFKLKMELLYQLGNIESAVVCYNDAKNLSRILNDVEYIKILEDLVKSQYHSILD